MSAIDWLNLKTWGKAATCVHIGSSYPDAHTASEEAAEGSR